MPTYDYYCPDCNVQESCVKAIEDRDSLPSCPICTQPMPRQVAAPLFKFMGRVTPGGGPDRFTADMLGIPLKELPSGLRTQEPEAKG